MSEETVRKVKECPVCQRLGEICEEAGEKSFCDELFVRLEKNELTADQFVDELMKNPRVKDALQARD